MIYVYSSGKEFYNDNKEMLQTDPYSEVFFKLDSEALIETNKDEYALKISDNKNILLAILKKPYCMLLFGDYILVPELVDFLIRNNYRIFDYLCKSELGDILLKEFAKKNIIFNSGVKMDFLECRTSECALSKDIEIPTIDDVDEIYQMSIDFVKECGLHDETYKENIAKSIENYRVIRKNGEIASMASTTISTPKDRKVSAVYTRPKYRGNGYSKKIVGHITREILNKGFLATLNVDQNNPISYHIYSSLGYKKIFSQGIYFKDPTNDYVSNAISWAKKQLGNTSYSGWCLSFIEDAYEKSNDIEIFGGNSAKESMKMYSDSLMKGIPEKGAFVFYDCLCLDGTEIKDYGHCGLSLGDGKIIHAWNKVRIDDYLEIEKLKTQIGEHPKYIGWVPITRVLKEEK